FPVFSTFDFTFPRCRARIGPVIAPFHVSMPLSDGSRSFCRDPSRQIKEVSMKKNVIITTDSFCDMPKELLERYQVRMIPLTISEGDHSYKDGVDFTPDDIYELYDSQHLLPKTSAISPQEFIDFFTPLTQDGSEV